jgi:nitroreductase
MKEILNLLLVIIEYFIDFTRTCKWSKSSPLCPLEKKLYYDIILLAHTVEKGLSVKNPRDKFGTAKISKLLLLLEKYHEKWDQFPVEKSYGCLQKYMSVHENRGIELGDFGNAIKSFLNKCKQKNLSPKGGVKLVHNEDFFNKTYQEGLLNRYSNRQYIKEKVSEDILDKIAEIVLRTPSQCNRQSGRLHYYSEPSVINNLLLLQGGAEGFREDVHNLFIVTSEMSAWSGFKARSQAYVDGSLLAMQVLNACQALNLASCPLNLAVSNRKELQICKSAQISSGERLIMMISFGYPISDDNYVARSERIQKGSLLIKHDHHKYIAQSTTQVECSTCY